MRITMYQFLTLLLCFTLFALPSYAEDSALSRRMAAEIIEQAAMDNKTYRETLLDVAKALRQKQMSVGEAKDLLTLAAACQELGANRNAQQAASQQFDTMLDPNKTADQRPAPPQLDIDKLLEDEAENKNPLFKNLDKEEKEDDEGYHSGLVNKKLPWNSQPELVKAKKKLGEQNKKERPEIGAKNKDAVNDKMVKKSRTKGKVTLVTPGLDGFPQTVLINFGAKDGLKKGQEILISRGGKALVKAIVNNPKDFEAIAIVMPATWAASVERKINVGDKVQEL